MSLGIVRGDPFPKSYLKAIPKHKYKLGKKGFGNLGPQEFQTKMRREHEVLKPYAEFLIEHDTDLEKKKSGSLLIHTNEYWATALYYIDLT